MTTQGVEVAFQTRSGRALTLFNADVDDSAEEEIQSGGNGLNVVSGVSLGQYGQGEVVTHAIAIASDAVCYAYIENQNGNIVCVLPISSDAGAFAGLQELCRPLQLNTGMKCMVRTVATTSALVSYSCYTSQGNYEVFTATASNGAAVNFASVKASLDIGRALQGQTIVKAYTSVQVSLNAGESGGSSFVQILDSTGQTKAMLAQQSTQVTTPQFQKLVIPVSQNDTSQVYYDSS